MSRRFSPAVFMLLFCAIPASAHDYWLQPDSFFPKLNEKIAVRLLVGDGFVSDLERPFQKKLTLRFQLVSRNKTVDLTAAAQEGSKPLVSVTLAEAGLHWIIIDRDIAYITLEAKKFNTYLKEEGLDRILADRKKSKEDEKPGRERYRRYLKCLLQAGDTTDDAWQKTFDQTLEIIPLANPAKLKVGEVLRLKVKFEGKPLSVAPLFAHARTAKGITTQRLQTDKDGIAAARLENSGPQLVRLVHMRRCANDPKADWESYWGAFAFAVP
jgi:hypothetical protein